MPRFAFLVLILSVCSVAHAQTGADDLFRQGRDALQRKEWPKARDLLTQSWGMKQTFDTAALLGQSEIKVGAHRGAAEHLNYALQHFPHQEPTPDARRRIEEAFQAAKSRVFTATISVEPSGAEVLVDGASVGRAPLGADVFLDVGAHTIEATLDGYESAKRDVDAQAGGGEKIELKLVKSASAPSGLSNQGPADPKSGASPINGGVHDQPRKSLVPAYIAGAVAAVGLIGAIVFEVGRSSKVSDAEDLRDRLGKGGCAPGTPQVEDCAALQDANSAADRNEVWRNVSAGVFVAGAATAIVWLLLPGPKQARPATRNLRIAPVSSRTGGGLFVTGTF